MNNFLSTLLNAVLFITHIFQVEVPALAHKHPLLLARLLVVASEHHLMERLARQLTKVLVLPERHLHLVQLCPQQVVHSVHRPQRHLHLALLCPQQVVHSVHRPQRHLHLALLCPQQVGHLAEQLPQAVLPHV
jgi:hypothetical protein